ncbi:hypothetical protein L798_06315 [Zootermopsis nevadensis]|uniref:Uncharacterized protein n=1 Tax=Zootermopsis nevadensis TaxID=136037 RepID=A0A067RKG6_ZOONE|nr:hypothetical protein L798_06315 [Zootermopsis nevadensis]
MLRTTLETKMETPAAPIGEMNSAALEGPRPSVIAIVYSSRKFFRTSDILSILRYGPVSVRTGGQDGT